MPRFHVTMALAMALATLCPSASRAETLTLSAGFEWRQADSMQALVSMLDTWLDARTEWPRRDADPDIRLVSPWEATARRGTRSGFQRGPTRGLYDPDTAEILLVRPWNPRNPMDVSVLLHELVHHRQAPHHWYCPAAQELPAYRLQDEWLAEHGLSADVNWIAVVLDAGCTPRDIHPE